MTEREWNIEKIAAQLKAVQEPVRDMLRGEGVALTTANIEGRLELYPERLVVRYRSENLRLDMTDVRSLVAKRDGVRIQAGSAKDLSTLFVSATKGISLILGATASSDVKASRTATEPAPPETPQPAPSPEPSTPPQAPAETAEQPQRVTLTGRVGSEPSARTTPNGRLVVRVPLAVHTGEETIWHRLIFFDALGKRVVETLHRGNVVSVIGYEHTREVTARTGEKRQVTEVYGASIQPTK